MPPSVTDKRGSVAEVKHTERSKEREKKTYECNLILKTARCSRNDGDALPTLNRLRTVAEQKKKKFGEKGIDLFPFQKALHMGIRSVEEEGRGSVNGGASSRSQTGGAP